MGLGMLTRMASAFDVYSRVDKGTVVFLEVRASDVAPDTTSNAGLPYGVICAPHAGETIVGDNWSVHAGAESWRALVVDGLGHGAFANEAAMEAVRVFESAPDEPAIDLMRRIHDALRKTRGAAGAILTFHPARSEVNFVGIGNIAATLLHKGKTRNMVSHNGTLGAEMRRIQEFTYPCPPDVLMLMFSDGLSSHWKLDGYPGLLHRHPSVIAAVLYRDFSRGRDDTTVLCARRNGVSKQ